MIIKYTRGVYFIDRSLHEFHRFNQMAILFCIVGRLWYKMPSKNTLLSHLVAMPASFDRMIIIDFIFDNVGGCPIPLRRSTGTPLGEAGIKAGCSTYCSTYTATCISRGVLISPATLAGLSRSSPSRTVSQVARLNTYLISLPFTSFIVCPSYDH